MAEAHRRGALEATGFDAHDIEVEYALSSPNKHYWRLVLNHPRMTKGLVLGGVSLLLDKLVLLDEAQSKRRGVQSVHARTVRLSEHIGMGYMTQKERAFVVGWLWGSGLAVPRPHSTYDARRPCAAFYVTSGAKTLVYATHLNMMMG